MRAAPFASVVQPAAGALNRKTPARTIMLRDRDLTSISVKGSIATERRRLARKPSDFY